MNQSVDYWPEFLHTRRLMKIQFFRSVALAVTCAALLLLSSGAVAEITDAELKKYALPEDMAGLPGEGDLRGYGNYLKNWPKFRATWATETEADQGAVVFLGDSITRGWGTDFKGLFPGVKLANRGIGGDTTRGMLIRLEDVLAVNPSAVVILMGTNDLEVDIEPEAIARNFELIIAGLKAHDPKMPIVLCLVFPSAEEKNRPMEKIKRVNELYSAAVKGDPQVTVIDTWTLFADENGDADPAIFKDLLHINAQGYEKWASALHPIFATLGFTDTEADDFVLEEGFESLFNGQDLTGWGFRPSPPRKKPKKPNPNAPVFHTVTEAISFDGEAASNDGRYVAINDRLVVTTPCEGRRIQQLWTTREFPEDFILKLEFRATPGADSGVFIRQPQLQCRDYWLAGPYTELKQYRPQDWNEMVVTVKGGTARSTCNGEVLEESMVVPETGPIGLEGDRGQIEYRRIRIKILP